MTMADRAKGFLSKSKWGRVLKEKDRSNDQQYTPQSNEPFALNTDVVDFLKPSTDKAALRPKINIAVNVAQRWPDAHEVRKLSETSVQQAQSQGLDYYRPAKPRRRKGLVVSFVNAAPEVIGIGGDEAPEPTREISRRRAAIARSGSERRPSALDSEVLRDAGQRQTQEQCGSPERRSVRPEPARRAQTHNEFSPAVQRKIGIQPESGDTVPARPTLGRIPTGFSSQDSTQHQNYGEDVSDLLKQKLELDRPIEQDRYDSAMSHGPDTSQRQHDMRANEGMALRRASAIYMPSESVEEVKEATSAGVQPPAGFYNVLASPAAHMTSPESMGSVSPESATTGKVLSPFEDPNYVRRRSGGMPVAVGDGERPQQVSGLQTAQQPRAQYQPSYIRVRANEAQPQSDGNIDLGKRKPSPNMPPFDFGERQSGSRASSESKDSPTKPRPFYPQQANTSSGSFNHFPRSPGFAPHRPDSQDGQSLRSRVISNSAGGQSPPSPRFDISPDATRSQSPHAAFLGPGAAARIGTSPQPRGPSPADYFSAPKAPPFQPARSPAVHLRQEDAARPGSAGSIYSAYRPTPSVQPPVLGDQTAEAALSDFGERVAHMKGVFRLTSERERTAESCTAAEWLRAGRWWYLIGKAGLETLLKERSRAPERPREMLTQAHVDLAKAWWISTDMLESKRSLQSDEVIAGNALLHSHLKALSTSIARSQLMPPHQSLIQGQDTRIWLDQPPFAPDAASVLGGDHHPSDSHFLPLGDTKDTHYYGNFAVEVSMSTNQADTDRVPVPCILTMLRSKRSIHASVVISSQRALVDISVGDGSPRSLRWGEDVSWKSDSTGLILRLARGYNLTVRTRERDSRFLRHLLHASDKLYEQTRAVAGEHLVHESLLAELQYADASNPQAFPAEKLRSCKAVVFERTEEHRDGNGVRRLHRGFRLLLMTDSVHKALSGVSCDVKGTVPLVCEFITDAAANGTTAMVLRVLSASQQCRILLVFPDAASRAGLYDVLTGMNVGETEEIVCKVSVTDLDIRATSQQAVSPDGILQRLQWQRLGVTNTSPSLSRGQLSQTVESESLRLVARHSSGSLTDRLNLGKGELLLRLPCATSATPTIELLRTPQEDLSLGVDLRHCGQDIVDRLADLLRLAQTQSTIHTISFASFADLHAFQTAITGSIVLYDGMASTFSIARRRSVVSVRHKWQASSVRVQIVQQGSVTRVLAFMEDFSHAEAMCFETRSSETFETVKGDGKGKDWAVRLVDAKFSLPVETKEKTELGSEEKVRRRFVNLEGLEYAEEHDDVTVAFGCEEGTYCGVTLVAQRSEADNRAQISNCSRRHYRLLRMLKASSRSDAECESVGPFYLSSRLL